MEVFKLAVQESEEKDALIEKFKRENEKKDALIEKFKRENEVRERKMSEPQPEKREKAKPKPKQPSRRRTASPMRRGQAKLGVFMLLCFLLVNDTGPATRQAAPRPLQTPLHSHYSRTLWHTARRRWGRGGAWLGTAWPRSSPHSAVGLSPCLPPSRAQSPHSTRSAQRAHAITARA